MQISCVCVHALSHVQLFENPGTITPIALQAHFSRESSRPEYWSKLPFPTPGDSPNPGIKPMTLKYPKLADGFFTTSIISHSYTYITSFWSLLLLPASPPSRSSQTARLGFLLHINSKSSPANCYIHSGVSMLMLLSPFIPFSPFPTVSTSPFSRSEFPFLP